MTPFKNPAVAEKFTHYPTHVRSELMKLRELIFQVASKDKRVGNLEETLKWNEPSYLTTQTKSGSTIRIDWKQKDPENLHLYFSCRTTLVQELREQFPRLNFMGKRAIQLSLTQKMPVQTLKSCILRALTYHILAY